MPPPSSKNTKNKSKRVTRRPKKKTEKQRMKEYCTSKVNEDGFPMKFCEYEPAEKKWVYRPPKYLEGFSLSEAGLDSNSNTHCTKCHLKPCFAHVFYDPADDFAEALFFQEYDKVKWRKKVIDSICLSKLEVHLQKLYCKQFKRRYLKREPINPCCLELAGLVMDFYRENFESKLDRDPHCNDNMIWHSFTPLTPDTAAYVKLSKKERDEVDAQDAQAEEWEEYWAARGIPDPKYAYVLQALSPATSCCSTPEAELLHTQSPAKKDATPPSVCATDGYNSSDEEEFVFGEDDGRTNVAKPAVASLPGPPAEDSDSSDEEEFVFGEDNRKTNVSQSAVAFLPGPPAEDSDEDEDFVNARQPETALRDWEEGDPPKRELVASHRRRAEKIQSAQRKGTALGEKRPLQSSHSPALKLRLTRVRRNTKKNVLLPATGPQSATHKDSNLKNDKCYSSDYVDEGSDDEEQEIYNSKISRVLIESTYRKVRDPNPLPSPYHYFARQMHEEEIVSMGLDPAEHPYKPTSPTCMEVTRVITTWSTPSSCPRKRTEVEHLDIHGRSDGEMTVQEYFYKENSIRLFV